MDFSKIYFLLNMEIFHCYVGLPEGNPNDLLIWTQISLCHEVESSSWKVRVIKSRHMARWKRNTMEPVFFLKR